MTKDKRCGFEWIEERLTVNFEHVCCLEKKRNKDTVHDVHECSCGEIIVA